MKLRRVFIVFFLCILMLTVSCSSRVSVVVNAIAISGLEGVGKNYVLTSAMDDIDAKDLFFQEFSHYFELVLQKQGYIKVQAKKEADIEILFGYGISDGMTDIATFSWPIYDTIGGESITITENSTDASGNVITTTRTIYIPPRIARVGTSIEAKSYTSFNRTAILEARKTVKAGETGDALWKLLISSVGASNDIRGVMPYLATAAAMYIGKNAREKREVIIEHNNPLLLELKNAVKK